MLSPATPKKPSRRKRFARVVLFLFAALATLLALFHAVENWRGHRAFEKFKREVETQGDTLDFRAMIPPPVPDDENFAMHPFLKPLLDYESRTKEHGTIWRDTNGSQRVNQFRLIEEHDKTNPMPRFVGVQNPEGVIKTIDLAAWQKFFRASTNYLHTAEPQSPAQDVLFALGKFDREFAELADAARRPKSRFPIHYDEPNSFGILLPQLGMMKSKVTLLNLLSAAQLAAGQTNEALATIQIAFKVSDSVKDEPLLISHLVRISCLAITLQSVAEGLAAHRWSEAQLLELEKRLGEIDLLAGYKKNMRGERNFILHGIDYVKSRPQEFSELIDDTMPGEAAGAGETLFAAASRVLGRLLVPNGWFDQNKVIFAGTVQHGLLTFADEQAHRIYPERAKDYEDEISKWRRTPYNFSSKLLLPALDRSVLRAGRLQTNLDQARLACALERHRLANGQFPEILDALVPKFVAKLPTDVITGGPLKYRREPDGRFVLYSVGLNGVDNGGTTVFKPGRKPVPDSKHGDWIWKYPARN